MNKWNQVRKSKRKKQEWLNMTVYLHECIRVEVISMWMWYVDSIDSLEFLSIELYLDYTLHHISDSVIWEPCINKDTYSLIFRIFDIEEEFCMSEWCDNHKYKENPLIGDLGVTVWG